MPLSGAALADVMHAALARDAGLRFTARGFSMHPFVTDGDVVTVTPAAWDEVDPGDIVACRSGEGLLVHRIVRRVERRLLVRGDNCESPDGLIGEADLLGRVTKVERRGHRVRLAVGPAGPALAALSRRGWLRPLVTVARRVSRPLRRGATAA